MTEEAQEQLFGQYWAAKKAVAAYGLSEDFEDEPHITTAPISSASWSANTIVERASGGYDQAVSDDYPRFIHVKAGAGRTYIFLRYARDSVKPLGIPPATLVTSGAAVTLSASGQDGSMATQQSPTTEDESVEQIIWRVGTTLSVRYRAKLTARLTELQRAVQEEEPDGRGIAVKSLQWFVEFLKAHPALRCPSITVTPERNIYASWKSGPSYVFSIHFLPDGKVRFVIFCPNDKHREELIRLSGTATADIIMSIATPHGVLGWVSDERPGDPRF
jgi:hypothetical protein